MRETNPSLHISPYLPVSPLYRVPWVVPACHRLGHRPCPYLPLSVMLDERSQKLMLAAIVDDIDVAQLEEESSRSCTAPPPTEARRRRRSEGGRSARRRGARRRRRVPGPAAGGEPAL